MTIYDLNLFEVWKPVIGFEGLYEVSSEGRVRSLGFWMNNRWGTQWWKPGRILKPGVDGGGYLMVDLQKDGVRYNKKVHRLVAEAFIPNPDNKPQINHLDENPKNNNINNLEWVTQKENNNYGNHNKKRIDTMVSLGRINPESVGLSKSEKFKLWRKTHREERNAYMRELYNKKKII